MSYRKRVKHMDLASSANSKISKWQLREKSVLRLFFPSYCRSKNYRQAPKLITNRFIQPIDHIRRLIILPLLTSLYVCQQAAYDAQTFLTNILILFGHVHEWVLSEPKTGCDIDSSTWHRADFLYLVVWSFKYLRLWSREGLGFAATFGGIWSSILSLLSRRTLD